MKGIVGFRAFVYGAEDQLINATITTTAREKMWGGINRQLMWSLVVYLKCLFCEMPDSHFLCGINKNWVNGNKSRRSFFNVKLIQRHIITIKHETVIKTTNG